MPKINGKETPEMKKLQRRKKWLAVKTIFRYLSYVMLAFFACVLLTMTKPATVSTATQIAAFGLYGTMCIAIVYTSTISFQDERTQLDRDFKNATLKCTLPEELQLRKGIFVGIWCDYGSIFPEVEQKTIIRYGVTCHAKLLENGNIEVAFWDPDGKDFFTRRQYSDYVEFSELYSKLPE